jgi:hypothetical protein
MRSSTFAFSDSDFVFSLCVSAMTIRRSTVELAGRWNFQAIPRQKRRRTSKLSNASTSDLSRHVDLVTLLLKEAKNFRVAGSFKQNISQVYNIDSILLAHFASTYHAPASQG